MFEKTPGVESARRVLNILLMFSEDRPELTVEDVMETHGISQTSAYRYLSLLRELNLIRLRKRGSYVLTPRVHSLAAASEHVVDLERVALPVLQRLSSQTAETAFLMRRARHEAVFVCSAEPERALALSFRAGATSPLHRGAVAKVLLAYSAHQFRDTYLGHHLPDADERGQFEAELARIRADASSQSLGEVDEGIWGGAVPVKVEGTVIASLSIAGPEFRIGLDDRAEIIGLLRAGAEEIARAIEAELEGNGIDGSGRRATP